MDDLSPEVRRYLRYLRRYWWAIAGGALIGVVAMFGLNRLSSSTEQGIALQEMVVVADRWTGLTSTTPPGILFAEDADALPIAVARLSDRTTTNLLRERFSLDSSGVAVTVEGRTVVMQVRADPGLARTVAAVLVRQLDESRAEDTLAPIERAITAVERRLEVLDTELQRADERLAGALEIESAELGTQLELLRVASAAIPSGLRSDIISQTEIPATAPVSGAFSPFLALIGVTVGALFAVVAIIVWSVVDRRVTTRRDVEAIIGAGSLLAVVPTEPHDVDLKAAAAAVEHLVPGNPGLSLVAVGPAADEVAASIAALSTTPCFDVEEILKSPTAVPLVPIATSGQVTAPELERLQFVVERAGGGLAGVILVGGRGGVDLLD